MYKEQLRSCEDLEDICDVRGFEQCRDDINMDVRIDKKDIKQAEGFDYVNYFNEEQASHCPKDCTNHAEFIITSFDKCCEQYSIENQSNMKNECEEECSKCYEPKNNCNYEPQCNDCYEIEDNCCYESKETLKWR